MIMVRHALLFSLLLMFFLSCRTEKSEIVLPADPPVPEAVDSSMYNGLLPMAVGNRWIYDGLGPGAVPETVTVRRTTVSGDLRWWKLRSTSFAMSWMKDSFAIRNDTVYVMMPNFLSGYYIQKVLYAPKDSFELFPFLFGGDVAAALRIERHQQPVTVPAGTFNEFISFALWNEPQLDSLVIVPGVGVVYHSVSYVNSGTRMQHIAVLEKYSLRTPSSTVPFLQ